MRLCHAILLLLLVANICQAEEPIVEPASGKNLFKLRQTFRTIRNRGNLTPPGRQSVGVALLDTFIPADAVGESPSDPWNERHRHFKLLRFDIDSIVVDDSLTLVRISGETSRLGSLAGPKIVPVAMQIAKDDGRLQKSRGRIYLPEAVGGPYRFELIFDRLEGATHTMVLFVNPDGSLAMYRDATSGEPKDQFLMVDLSEELPRVLKRD